MAILFIGRNADYNQIGRHIRHTVLHICTSLRILIISSEQCSDVLSLLSELFNREMHLCCYGDNEQIWHIFDPFLHCHHIITVLPISCPLRHWPQNLSVALLCRWPVLETSPELYQCCASALMHALSRWSVRPFSACNTVSISYTLMQVLYKLYVWGFGGHVCSARHKWYNTRSITWIARIATNFAINVRSYWKLISVTKSRIICKINKTNN